MRPIFKREDFAVLELRGGTHLVLTRTKEPIAAGAYAPFDLMTDDLEATFEACAALGLRPSEIEHGRVHRSFTLEEPSGYRVTFVSSHTDGRPV